MLFYLIVLRDSYNIYNYFTEKLKEFYFTKSSQDKICIENIQSAARDVLQAKFVAESVMLVKDRKKILTCHSLGLLNHFLFYFLQLYIMWELFNEQSFTEREC